MSNKLNQYSGQLTAEQIVVGMNAAKRNSRRLLYDANLLAEANRYASAIALAILAIEESGKVSILREISYTADNKALAKTWKRYRLHTAKNVLWGAPDLIRAGAREVSEFKSLFDGSSDHPIVLEQVKQIALYTDCLNKGKWTEPEEVIEKDLTLSIIGTAKALVSDKDATVAEVELWVNIMGPVLRQPISESWVRTAFKRWYEESVRLGLIDPKDKLYRAFVYGNSDDGTVKP